jgi:hypothetical protein
MLRLVSATLVVLLVLIYNPSVASAQCAKIKDGTIFAGNGVALTLGYDQWGYNYQAHMFNGLVENYTRPAVPATEGAETLIMKWSDDWLANVDCDGDGKLDRGYTARTGLLAGFSKGWVTNHYEGDYVDAADGESYHYTWFTKIVYDGGIACESGDPSCLWALYTIIEDVYNDPHGGFHGNDRSKLVTPAGLGQY